MENLWTFCSLVLCYLMKLTYGQLDNQNYTNLSMDQIMTRLLGGVDVIANRLTLPGGTILNELDMLLTQEQYESLYDQSGKKRKKRKAISDITRRWQGGKVYYRFKPGDFSDAEIYMAKVAMREWEKYTCLSFHEATDRTRNYILFQDGLGCSSQLGEVGGAQPLNLDRNGCRFKGLYLHEIAHAVGIVHEQQLPNRDNYVDIIWQNVQPGLQSQFTKYNPRYINQFGVDYEYSSVMHYGVYAFSKDGRSQTIRTKDPSREKEIGKVYQKELGFTDVEIANKMYQCANDCPNTRCVNGGFVDQNCDCICPDGSNDCKAGQRTDTSCRNSGRDLNSWKCYIWSRQGECVRNKNFMRENCQKACGYCGTEGQTQIDRCGNNYESYKCEKWKAIGDCIVAEDFMKKNCRRTCGFCDDVSLNREPPGTQCQNSYSDASRCEFWALKGECVSNPRWMPFNCQKACRTCPIRQTTRSPVVTPSVATLSPVSSTVRPVTTTMATRRTTTGTTTTQCNNYYPDDYCQRNQQIGECERIPDWMKLNCEQACGLCNQEEVCKDRYESRSCGDWASAGLCESKDHMVWMQANCRKTCRVCVEKDKETTTNEEEQCRNIAKDENCNVWARYNHCVVNPGYMLVNCMKSCRVCTEGLKESAKIYENKNQTEITNETGGNNNGGTSLQLTSVLLAMYTAMKWLL